MIIVGAIIRILYFIEILEKYKNTYLILSYDYNRFLENACVK